MNEEKEGARSDKQEATDLLPDTSHQDWLNNLSSYTNTASAAAHKNIGWGRVLLDLEELREGGEEKSALLVCRVGGTAACMYACIV